MSESINSLQDILAQVKAPAAVKVDVEAVARGIDNYHVDVELSELFIFRIRETLDQNLKRLVSGKALISGNAEAMVEVRNAYVDLMKVSLHRTKTDLEPAQLHVLQFAVVKFVIQEVREVLDRYAAQLEETLGQQQYAGSRSLMSTQEKVTWFRKHANEFLYRLTRLYLRQLQREENNQLKTLREQVLGDFPQATNILFNPLLYARGPRDQLLLLDYYACWSGNGFEFDQLNRAFEEVYRKHFSELKFDPLNSDRKLASGQAEVYDELGGLFASQALLGPAEDQKSNISETFSWLEHPGNVRLLFDEKVHDRHLQQEGLGLAGSWSLKGDLKKLAKIAQELKKAIGDAKAVKRLLASYALREKLSQPDLDHIEIDDALALVSGVDSRKASAAIDMTREGSSALAAKLEECREDFERLYRDAEDELLLRLLTDHSRYRMHLKYYRMAHRLFNRVSVITEPQKIQLAKAGGHLYRLMSADEVKEVVAEDDQPQVVHHAILKADVRGSTTVTQELLNQGLNAASYFSLRFFDPITSLLGTYGAVKVFIEGDAVILGVYEHDNTPDEWFSVSRACGIAKEIIDIVNSKNAHSRQTGLPMLEVGIGICYSDDRPMFLFDEKRPIMISSAIGKADRMSGCSWKLREVYEPGHFNVSAFKMVDGEAQKGEKGQELIRYNVNGIVVDQPAFEKLQNEVHFRRLKARTGESEEVFYFGQFPDVQGKQRDLIVREGRVGLWQDDQPDHSVDTGHKFHEILPNSKFASQIAEMARKKA